MSPLPSRRFTPITAIVSVFRPPHCSLPVSSLLALLVYPGFNNTKIYYFDFIVMVSPSFLVHSLVASVRSCLFRQLYTPTLFSEYLTRPIDFLVPFDLPALFCLRARSIGAQFFVTFRTKMTMVMVGELVIKLELTTPPLPLGPVFK